MINFEEVFNDSYERVAGPMANADDFFETFYQKFIHLSPEIADKFKNTNMKIQKRMLQESILRMLTFFVTKEATDYLEEIADKHSAKQHGIEPRLYDLWLDCLIDTLKEKDISFNEKTELAWRVVLSPGISYMKFRYEHPSKN